MYFTQTRRRRPRLPHHPIPFSSYLYSSRRAAEARRSCSSPSLACAGQPWRVVNNGSSAWQDEVVEVAVAMVAMAM